MHHKEGWVANNWCFWNVVLEKTFESPLDSKKIKSVNLKGNQSWIFIGRTDAEVEAPILWPPNVKRWLTGKDPDAGKDWRQEEKGTTEDEMVEWHYRLSRYGFELREIVKDREAWCAAVHRTLKSWAWLSYCTTTIVTWDSKWQVSASEAPQPSRVIVLTPLILSTYLIASQLIHFHYSLTEIQISTINSKDNTGFTRTQRRLGK